MRKVPESPLARVELPRGIENPPSLHTGRASLREDGGDAELMGAWQSARNVVGPSGSRVTPSEDEGEPPAPGDIAPAA
jgi:hypothetical protein